MPDTDNQSTVPRVAHLAALAVAVLALALYLRTLHPGVGPSLDSMELQIAALVGGVIHPPGSPQYLMLGYLAMTILPGPTPAFRLNMMSALAAAATVGVIDLLAYRLTRNLIISGYASLSLALALLFWYQASITELYALNALYVALVLYFLVAWHQTSRPHFYWLAVAGYALSFGNHVSMILLLPAFVYTVAITDRTMLLRPRNLLITAGIVMVAALQYLYIPIRAAANPPFCNYCPGPLPSAWDTVRGPLLDYLTGGPFKGAMLAVPRREVLARLPESIGQWNQQFMPWGYALGLVGAWELLRRQARLGWLFVLAMVAEYGFVMTYAIPDWYTFMTPCYVIFAPLMGRGALSLSEMLQTGVEGLRRRQAYSAALAGLGALTLAVGFYANLPLVDQSQKTDYESKGRALLAQAQPGAWLLMPRPDLLDSFYASWAVSYLAFAGEGPGDVVFVAPPEVNPPPGPEPYYLSWANAAPRLTNDSLLAEQLAGTRPQILVLDPADDRVASWGLLPICTADEQTIVGYEVVAVTGPRYGPLPLVDAGRWDRIPHDIFYPPYNGRPHCPEN